MPDFKLISADGHVNEPPMAWERVQKEYGDRAPKVVKDPPGVVPGTWLITDGLVPVGVSHFSTGLVLGKPEGVSQADMDKVAKRAEFNEKWDWQDYPAGWEPTARLEAQDRDGIEAEMLFPSPGRFFYGLTDGPFQHAIHRSYNLWLHEFSSAYSQRLNGIALLGVLDVEQTVRDIQEYAKLGFRAGQLPTGIKDGGYYEPKYDPIFQAAEETGMVLCVHTSATQGEQRTHFEGPSGEDPRRSSIGFASRQAPAQRFMGHLMFSGVFDRHPNLKVTCAEYDVGWVAHIYQLADYMYGGREGSVNKLLPSEYFKRNIFFTFQDDRAGVLTSEIFGQDNFMWANDFPHAITTWPYSQETVDANFVGIDPAVKRKICRENAIKLYGLDL
jgi:predicted TIM-barrel fold metal-dependent hydrolase